MFKNDERYWDINLLNKWFAISSLVFLAVIVWMFIDDNDDEFKEYQKEFRKLQVDITKSKLDEEQSLVEGKAEEFEAALAEAVKIFDQKSEKVKNITYLSKKELFLKLGINTKKKIILITFHPETNNYKSYPSQIRTLLESLKNFKNLFLVFTGSNGDPNGKMFNQEMKKFIKKNDNSIFFSSLGNTNYLNLMRYANAVLGNSSSAIIEAPSFGIPVINIGNRQSGRELSSNIFSCKLNRNAIINEIKKLKKIRKKVFVKNLNFKKNAIIKIANKIKFLSKKVKPDFKYFDD